MAKATISTKFKLIHSLKICPHNKLPFKQRLLGALLVYSAVCWNWRFKRCIWKNSQISWKLKLLILNLICQGYIWEIEKEIILTFLTSNIGNWMIFRRAGCLIVYQEEEQILFTFHHRAGESVIPDTKRVSSSHKLWAMEKYKALMRMTKIELKKTNLNLFWLNRQCLTHRPVMFKKNPKSQEKALPHQWVKRERAAA